QRHVSDHGANAQRLARKVEAERAPHEAAAAVRRDEIADAQGLLAVARHNPRRDAIFVLLKADQFPAELDMAAEFGEPVAHDLLRPGLRDHQRNMIRFGRRWLRAFAKILLDEASVTAVDAHHRVEPASGHDLVEDAEGLKDFLRSRLDTLAARARKRLTRLVAQAESD